MLESLVISESSQSHVSVWSISSFNLQNQVWVWRLNELMLQKRRFLKNKLKQNKNKKILMVYVKNSFEKPFLFFIPVITAVSLTLSLTLIQFRNCFWFVPAVRTRNENSKYCKKYFPIRDRTNSGSQPLSCVTTVKWKYIL